MKLYKKLFITIILLFFILFSIFSYIIIKNYRDREYKNFKSRMNYLKRFTVDTNKLDLWNYNIKSIKKYIITIMEESSLKSLYFFNTKKKSIIIGGKKENDKINFFENKKRNLTELKKSNKYMKEVDIYYNDYYISTLLIGFTSRHIKKRVVYQIYFYIINFFVLALILLVTLYIFLNKFMLKPFNIITEISNNFGRRVKKVQKKLSNEENLKSSDLKDVKLDLKILEKNKNFKKNDEIGKFFRRFHTILQTINKELQVIYNYSSNLEDLVEKRTKELKKTQKKMVEQAHKAGMAELASSTLHNIGNAANSLSVKLEKSPSKIIEKNEVLYKSYKKILNLLKENENNLDEYLKNDKTGRRLFSIFEKTNNQLNEITNKMKKENRELKEIIKHVIDIIHVQNSYTFGVQSLKEKCKINKLMDDAAEILLDSLRKRDIKLIKKYKSNESIEIEKNRLIQVVVNLIKNSIEAIDHKNFKNKDIDKKIILRTRDFSDYLLVSVIDNGIGIKKEVMPKIFNYKYSTKKRGSGFGLHYCGNFMNNIGGKVVAYSKGENKGARITLIFPIEN